MTHKFIKIAAFSALVLASAVSANAATKFVGGAPMVSSSNIVTNASKAKNLTTLVAAVSAAGLVDTLASPGPFTVFAPTNAAFAALPKGTVETLLKPENKATLTKILTAHVVAGDVSAAALKQAIKSSGGTYRIHTVSGDTLAASMLGLAIVLTDESGGKSYVTIPDVKQSNGVVHVVNKVLLPK